MILTPNVEGQGVLDRTEEGAEANLLYLRYVYIWGGKGRQVLFQSKDKYRGPLKDSITERLQVKAACRLPFILSRSTLGSEDFQVSGNRKERMRRHIH